MPIHNATLHQLRIFHTLTRHMSMARTAEALGLTPPAVSIQVRQLSESAGLPLIEQVGKQLYLTDAGQAMAAGCRDLLDRMERLDQELAQLKGVENGRLRLAIITNAKYFVPQLLGRFCDRHPAIELSLFVGNRGQVIERLKQNQDDLYVLGRIPKELPVHAEAFAENPLVVVAVPGHPLTGEREIPPQRLAEEPLILREPGSGTRAVILDFFERNQVELNVRMELGSNEAIKQCVMAGLGISVLSLNNLQPEIAAGRIAVLDVAGFPLKRQWHLVHLRDHVLSPTSDAFRRYALGDRALPVILPP
ncbi:LysR family transcriptional regulator [Endothiovibrio diazotrophicus]